MYLLLVAQSSVAWFIPGAIILAAMLKIVPILALAALLPACSVIEQSSVHGFHSGQYVMHKPAGGHQQVYLDISDTAIRVFSKDSARPGAEPTMTMPLNQAADADFSGWRFSKTSLDIDITSILLKYRFGTDGRQSELITDFNAALYAGWRRDGYKVKPAKDPLGKRSAHIRSSGYDFGVFAGLGSAAINDFSTAGRISDEYNGLIIQCGIAGFLETKWVSFGLALGYDFLANSDKAYWVYHKKPWTGLIIGIALN